MRCPRCLAEMSTWPYDAFPFCEFCGFELARRKTDRVKLDVANKLDRISGGTDAGQRCPETK